MVKTIKNLPRKQRADLDKTWYVTLGTQAVIVITNDVDLNLSIGSVKFCNLGFYMGINGYRDQTSSSNSLFLFISQLV